MNTDDREFALKLIAVTKTHEEWLGVVRFGLDKLIHCPGLLLLIIAREAHRVTATGAGEEALLASTETIMRELMVRISH